QPSPAGVEQAHEGARLAAATRTAEDDSFTVVDARRGVDDEGGLAVEDQRQSEAGDQLQDQALAPGAGHDLAGRGIEGDGRTGAGMHDELAPGMTAQPAVDLPLHTPGDGLTVDPPQLVGDRVGQGGDPKGDVGEGVPGRGADVEGRAPKAHSMTAGPTLDRGVAHEDGCAPPSTRPARSSAAISSAASARSRGGETAGQRSRKSSTGSRPSAKAVHTTRPDRLRPK